MLGGKILMEETWKNIPGCEGKYLASSSGRVMAIEQRVKHCPKGVWLERVIPCRILKTYTDRLGYKRTTLTLDGERRQWLVHRLVAQTYIENPSHRPHVNHIDGCKSNNDPSNLEWVTHAENMAHAARMGLMFSSSGPGMESPAAKLTDECVRDIKRRLAAGDGPACIARDYPVKPGAIGEIKAGRSWSHISIHSERCEA